MGEMMKDKSNSKT